MSTLTLDLPPALWMSANRPITNHGHRQRVIEMIHALTHDVARMQRLPAADGTVRATWTIHYPKGVTKKADPPNSYPTCKAILDALVPEWLVDDSAQFVTFQGWQRGPNLDERGWHRVVLELEEVARG
jgi:hypothetical protein